jgi:hypothetical protein
MTTLFSYIQFEIRLILTDNSESINSRIELRMDTRGLSSLSFSK